MTRHTNDDQVVALAAASASVRTLAAIDAGLRRSWPRSVAARLWVKIVPAASGSSRLALIRQAAGLVAIAAATAALLALLGARRDGSEWVVPVAVGAVAVIVLLASPAARDSQ